MARPEPLDSAQLRAALGSLNDWNVIDGKLHKVFTFGDFGCAFGFMASAATYAEKIDHHPEWSNVYATVVVDLVTHDAGGITDLDVQFARRLDDLAGH
ncbi:MAG: 4a-hydroxytetrahydrobiopterin dehydratase [Actinobacteria bacterium]|nr:4a-hydroxytetrahydrobiopterin dehydratase [Actinomycetota bacterium]